MQLSDLQLDVNRLRHTFETGRSKTHKFRLGQLKALKRLLVDNKPTIIQAMQDDFKGEPEAVIELDMCVVNVDFAMKNLHKWMHPANKPTSLPFKLDSAWVAAEPRGVVFIIGPWNYPLALLIDPFIGAISAGNCALLKASSRVPRTSDLLEALFPKYLNQDCYQLRNINAQLANSLLQETKFDFVFFTGGYQAGQQIYEQAARMFTPVLMELGGKSPCIITEHADMRSAVGRVSWGKYINAGQSCIAPDFVIVTAEAIKLGAIDELVRVAKAYSIDYFANEKATKIVSDSQIERLEMMLNEVPQEWKVFVHNIDRERRIFGPALVVIPRSEISAVYSKSFSILREEIFGTILPIIAVADIQEAVKIAKLIEPHPLALYLFSQSQTEIDFICRETTSGSVCINDVMLQIMNPHLPFGGVGKSGIGKYHGKYSFDAFSNFKSILHRTVRDEFINARVRYPPNLFRRHKILSKLLSYH